VAVLKAELKEKRVYTGDTPDKAIIKGSVKNYVSKGLVVCHNISFSSS
jgi:hypothetical protein